ncbi:hypothetical protein [Mammaliicoccus sciuri]|uniref:hypothetical protein n=1 Tax=Mammaliicoccus sciuri TaxID=1296 RepID=UPI000E676F5B|nr:hypothetical protein [Mammaliicoccus sciuri]RIN99445.1 hypothetical protein BU000_02765 [Mammaliicoccus sciuri]
MVIIFIWAFLEGIVFFIIPDVALTYYAIMQKSKFKLLCANLIAIIGAVLGGIIVYIISIQHLNFVEMIMINIPGIHPYMIKHVIHSLEYKGVLGLIEAPLFGIPYKLYAMMSYHEGISFIIFIIVSFIARLLRFILTSYLAYVLSHIVFKNVNRYIKILLWLIVWIIVYWVYFSIHSF